MGVMGPQEERRIVSLVKRQSTRYHNHTHKFGSELPKSVDEAYAIDATTGTTFWRDAIEKEMKNVRVAFNVLREGAAPRCATSGSSVHVMSHDL